MTDLEKVALFSWARVQNDEAGYESDTEVCTIITGFTVWNIIMSHVI